MNDLEGDRGPSGLIPWLAIREYGLHYGLAGNELEVFVGAVLAADRMLRPSDQEQNPAPRLRIKAARNR